MHRVANLCFEAQHHCCRLDSASHTCSTLQTFAIAVVGDLHLEPGQMSIFDSAARQLSAAMTREAGAARLVQLGDLGGYDHHPGGLSKGDATCGAQHEQNSTVSQAGCTAGSMHCFKVAAEYLEQIPAPRALVAGNHDLEGDEFETDEQNLAAWTQVHLPLCNGCCLCRSATEMHLAPASVVRTRSQGIR